jgi:arylsulfate sulfotransferase
VRQILDQDRTTYLDVPEDWFHMNSVWYDSRDGSLVVSGRNQTAVVKISSDGELLWILGPHRGWVEPWAGRLLTAVDDTGTPFEESIQLGDAEPGPDFRWPWGQHAAMYLPNGNVFLFDNGFIRTWSSLAPLFSRGVEYEIDEERMTVRQVWQYGEERGSPYYSTIISDVDHLPITGNRLIMPGLVQQDRKAFVTEVAYPSGDLIFDAVIDFKRALGTGAGWGQFDLIYRSERLTLYPPTW